ncbi:MAG: hypothetical protein WBC90_14815 [Albidovulum sp.]
MTTLAKNFLNGSRRRLSVLAVAGAFAISGFATIATAAEFMTEKELLQTIPGSVIRSTSRDGTKWVQSYSGYKGGAKKGIIKGNFGGTKYDAKWFLKKGQWCENWGDGQACWQVERVDEKSLQMYRDGKAERHLWKLK